MLATAGALAVGWTAVTERPAYDPSRARFRHVILTDVGQVRERNEDLAWGSDELGLFLLADGMGGHPDGNGASRIAIETAVATLTGRDALTDPESRAARMAGAILAANRAIMAASPSTTTPAPTGMGTTLSCLWLDGQVAEVAHVGDSRIYRLRGTVIEQLTRDHTVACELINRGVIQADSEEARQLGHILTQAVGLEQDLHPDTMALELTGDDVYLLCSDGLSDLVEPELMADLLLAAEGDLDLGARSLVEAALAAGGHDNVTVLLVCRQEDACT